MISHDWPTIVGDVTDKKKLLRIKPHFKEDVHN